MPSDSTMNDHQRHQIISLDSSSSTKSSLKAGNHSPQLLDDSATSVELFGGAIICNFPKTFIDLSTIRQVPDNQEVWISSITNNCFILEILQFQEDAAEDNPLDFFFHDLVTQNSGQDDCQDNNNCYCSLVPNFSSVQNYWSTPSDHNDPFILGDHLPSIPQENSNTCIADGSSTDSKGTSVNRVTVSVGVGLQYSSETERNEIFRNENFIEMKFQPEISNQHATWIQIDLCLVRLWSLQTDILITYTKSVPAVSQITSESILDQARNISNTYERKEFLEICRSIKIVDWNLFAS
jgi:hypothetical protein